MLNPRLMLKDSLIAMSVLALGSGLFGGWMWALATAGGGTVVLISLWFTATVTAKGLERQVEGQGGAGLIAIGLLAKAVFGLGAVFGLLQVLPGLPVMLGVLSVVTAIAVRNMVSMFISPPGAQEA